MPLCVVLGCFNRHKDGKRMLRFPVSVSISLRRQREIETETPAGSMTPGGTVLGTKMAAGPLKWRYS